MKHLRIYEDFKYSQELGDLFGFGFKLVLPNRAEITGPSWSEGEVREMFNDRDSYKMIESCYASNRGVDYYMDYTEVRRAECAENNIRNTVEEKLKELNCEIKHYRPICIEMNSSKIKAYAYGASDPFGERFVYNLKRDPEYIEGEERKVWRREVFSLLKEFAKKHGVTHVLAGGGRLVIREPLINKNFPNSIKEHVFIPIEKFNWDQFNFY